MKKLCPVCNFQNEPAELFCSKCLANISAVRPGPSADAEPKKPDEQVRPVGLFLLFQEKEIAVLNGDIYGRESKGKEILTSFPGVSRKHAEFISQDGKWFVIDKKSSNGTFLNNKRIPSFEPVELKSGDCLGFSRKVEFKILLKSE